MSTALLNRIATLKQRVEKLEKAWGIKKSASEIGEEYESPRIYANNGQHTVAEVLALAVSNGNETLRRKLLESPTYQQLVRNSSNTGDGRDSLRENAAIVAELLRQSVEADAEPDHGPRRETIPLSANVPLDKAAFAEALRKTADLETMKAILAKSGRVGHVDLLDQQRAIQAKVRDLLHQARRIAMQ